MNRKKVWEIVGGEHFLKFDLKMKLTTLFLIVSFLNLYANDSYAQKTKISLHMENATIEQVLETFHKNYNIDYSMINNQIIIN